MNNDGSPLLHLSIMRSDTKSSLFLLESGAQVNLTSSQERSSPLHLLAASKNENNLISVAQVP